MATLGFSAQHSLRLPTVTYSRAPAAEGRNYVAPVFLGPIGEAFEHVVEGIKEAAGGIGSAATSLANAVASAYHSLQSAAGPAGTQFVCSQFVTQALTCNGNSPAQATATILNKCIQKAAESDSPEVAVGCAALSAATYALAQQYCQNPSQDITPYLQRACPQG